MHENFISLQQEKRDRIINAAMQEFLAKGFKNASTNEIVKKSEISKGALFHYFSSKRDLFEFIYNYCLELFSGVLEPYMENLPQDIFERWAEFAMLKMKLKAQYSLIFEFTISMAADDDAGVKEYIASIEKKLANNYSEKIYSNIDKSKFKPDVDIQKAMQIILWVVEGYATAKRSGSADVYDEKFFNDAVREMSEYLDVLKKVFYKEESI